MNKLSFFIIVANIVHYPLLYGMESIMQQALKKMEEDRPVQTADHIAEDLAYIESFYDPAPVTQAAASSSTQASGRTTQADDHQMQAAATLEYLASRTFAPSAHAEKSTRILDKSAIRVENNTNDSLLIRFQKKLTKLCESTLMPGQFIDFSPANELMLLQVKPYGQYKGLVSKETLYMKLPNLVNFVRLEAERLRTPRVKLSVQPYWNASVSGRLAYPLAFACEKTMPYSYVCDYTEQLDEYTSLDEVFPQLARAVKNNILDEARLALNLPLQAEKVNAHIMYDHLYSQLRDIKRRDEETQRFARDAITILGAAFLAVTNREMHLAVFVQLVRKHFMQKQTYNVRADARPLLGEFLEERGKEVLQAEQCDQAITALKKLMSSWPRFNAFMKTRPANGAVICMLAEKYFRDPSQSLALLALKDVIRVAFMLGTPAARDWVLYKISEKGPDSFRYCFDVVYAILDGFQQSFNKMLVEELVKDKDALDAVDEGGNSIFMRSVIEENFDLALFLMGFPLCRTRLNIEGKNVLQLAKDKERSYRQRLEIDTQTVQPNLGKCADLIAKLEQPMWKQVMQLMQKEQK